MSLINKPLQRRTFIQGFLRAGPTPALSLFSRPYRFTMSAATKLAVVVTAVAGLFITSGIVAQDEAVATPAFSVQQANPTITITSEGTYFTYSPTQLDARVGQAITVTNNDPLGATVSSRRTARSPSTSRRTAARP